MPVTKPTGSANSSVKLSDHNKLVDAFNVLEADFLALKAQLVKGEELRARLSALEDFVELNSDALRVIFTVFQPGVTQDTRAQADQIQLTLALWLAKLGGRVPLEGGGP